MSSSSSPRTVSNLLIVVTVIHALAVIVTSFRLWFRHHIRRLWWDDFWAVLALASDFICMVGAWTTTAPLDNPYTNIELWPTQPLSRESHIISSWLIFLAYTCSIWFARMSIAMSVVRIAPPTRSVTWIAFGTCVLFACIWVYLMIVKSIICAADNSWHYLELIVCPLPWWVGLSEICTDVTSDIILVALPIRLLWHIKLPSNERIMVLSIFATSILVSVISAVHTAYLIPRVLFLSAITAHLESAICLIVCNLLVVVTFVYRVTKCRDLTAPVCKRTPSGLTTVDLDVSGGSLFSTNGIALETGFSGATSFSSVVFANVNDKGTFGSIVESERTILPVLAEDRDERSLSVMEKR